MIFYAKPDQTYREHLEAVYSAWKDTIKAKRLLIERLCGKYQVPSEDLILASLLSVVFHDIGKMIEPFQQMMSAIRAKKPFDMSTNYRHELFSFVYTVKYWHLLNRKVSVLPIEALAVVGHHKSLDSDLDSFSRESLSSPPKILQDGINEALFIAEEKFKAEGFILPALGFDEKVENPYESLKYLLGYIHKGIEKDGAEKIRSLYFLLKGILHYADWHGSGKATVRYSTRKNDELIIDDLKKRCAIKGITFNGLRPFQRKCSSHSGHLIAIAPTGSGKTEASVLWALNNAKEMGGAKIIYLLPTMVTANSIWERLTEFFDEENVGLTHSTANLFIQKETPEEEEDKWENRRDLLFNQSFIKPVTIGTVDQLLTAGFNSGRWVLKEVNASNSTIIIDEIHAYDGWTLGLIIETMRHFTSLGARFMVMSATLPDALLKLLSDQLKDAVVIKEETLLKAKRSKYFVKKKSIENDLDKIEEAVRNGKKVLVVVNTIGLCQLLSKQLSALKPVCYHSQFILKDRKAIEDSINEVNFMIATQVVEVSLDIDFDWLFTECAPPDAIAQRAGRINRYRDPQRDSRVFIYKASEKAGKIYNPINDPNLLSRSFDEFTSMPCAVSEEDLVRAVENVYKGFKVDDSEYFREAMQQYSLSQKRRNMIFDSRLKDDKQETTRRAKYETVPVIPVNFVDEVMNIKPAERKWYEIKLPLWYVLRNKREESGITFCDVEYDKTIGATLKKEDQESTIFALP